jgi:phage anti-repressor protein
LLDGLRQLRPNMEEPKQAKWASREAMKPEPEPEIPAFLKKENNQMNETSTVPSAPTEPGQGLIPVFAGEIGGVPCNVCDGRALHTFLEIGKDFTTWIKDRIEKYGLIENQDFTVCSPALGSNGTFDSPNLGSKTRGGHNRTDYHLTLDTAKELSMVENNDQGRQARRYFIECERRVLESASGTKPLPGSGTGHPVVDRAVEFQSWRYGEEYRRRTETLMGRVEPEDKELLWEVAFRVKKNLERQLFKNAKDHLARKLRPDDVANWILAWEPSGLNLRG